MRVFGVTMRRPAHQTFSKRPQKIYIRHLIAGRSLVAMRSDDLTCDQAWTLYCALRPEMEDLMRLTARIEDSLP